MMNIGKAGTACLVFSFVVTLVSCSSSPERADQANKTSPTTEAPQIKSTARQAQVSTDSSDKDQNTLESPEQNPNEGSSEKNKTKTKQMLSTDDTTVKSAVKKEADARPISSTNKKHVRPVQPVTKKVLSKAESNPKAPKSEKQVSSSSFPSSPEETEQANTRPKSIAITDIPRGDLSGTVKIVGKKGKRISPKGVIVNLRPIYNASRSPNEAKTHVISMKNKRYGPRFITAKPRDIIAFDNNDKIKHNVFSSSGENTFDLGTYGVGKTRQTELKATGIVKVYCNIHPEMAAFVLVSEDDYSSITDKNGHFHIDDLPAGQYELLAWHIRGQFSQVVNISAGSRQFNEISIDSSNYKRVPHKNKHGKNYKKNQHYSRMSFTNDCSTAQSKV